MKLLFITPPRPNEKSLFLSTQFPVGLGFLMTYMKELGHEVRFLDYDTIAYDSEELLAVCREFQPEMVGLTAMTPQIVQANKVAKLVKEALPEVITVIGGKHVSVMPERTLETFSGFDLAVVGEGEYTLAELLDNLGDAGTYPDIKGLVWRRGDVVVVNSDRPLIHDLDEILYADRSLFDIESYGQGMSFKGMWRTPEMTEIITARGCPNRCIFCSSQIITKRKVRYRSIAHIQAELDECYDKYGFRHFRIVDDTFTLKRERVYALCDWFEAKKVTWNCNARVNTVDLEMLTRMKQSGCVGVMYGVESGSPEILKKMKKGINLEQIRNAFQWSHEAGISIIEADFVLGGHPDETLEDIEMSRALIKEIKPHYLGLGSLVPYPGCEARDIMIKKGLIEDRSLEDWNAYDYTVTDQGWRYTHFTLAEIQAHCKHILNEFYLTPRFFFYNLKRMTSWRELIQAARVGWQFLRFIMKKGR